MQYKYRWFYAVLLLIGIISVGFFYQLYPVIIKLQTLRITRLHFLEKIEAFKTMSKQRQRSLINPIHNVISVNDGGQAAFLEDIFTLAHLNNLDINALYFLDNPYNLETIKLVVAHLAASGHFAQINAFIHQVANQSNKVITNFSYKLMGEDKLTLTMEIQNFNVIDTNQKSTMQTSFIGKNPFCIAADLDEDDLTVTNTEILSVSLAQMKMIGYLHQAKHKQALILLPSGAVVAVEISNLLGKEHGVVTHLAAHYILIELTNKKQMALRLV